MILLIPLLAFGLDIDEDSNDAVDIAYGGTNAITAAAARTALGAAPLASPTFTGTVTLPSNQALLGSPTAATSIDPDAADGATLGSATKEWSDLFLASGGVIYGENDQSNYITSSATGWVASLNFYATTYGSDGSITDTEFKYINTLTSNAQDQIDAKLDSTHAAQHTYGGADITDRLFEGVTLAALTVGDATPPVASKGLYDCTGGTTITITNFYDSGDDNTGDFSDGDYIGVLMNDADVTIGFSGALIEGNSETDFKGHATSIVLLLFIFYNDVWYCPTLNVGMSDAVTLAVDTVQAGMNVIPSAGNITLTAAQMNSIIHVSQAGDVQILADQCDTATGKWITVKQTGAYEVQVEALDAADDFYLVDGTKIEGSTNELGTAGASGNQITLTCVIANQWWVTGQIGTSVDAGAID